MATYFCDTSALAKRYVTETGSVWLTTTIAPKVGKKSMKVFTKLNLK